MINYIQQQQQKQNTGINRKISIRQKYSLIQFIVSICALVVIITAIISFYVLDLTILYFFPIIIIIIT